MTNHADSAARLVSIYNDKNFDKMSALIAPKIDFAHFNRDFHLSDRDELITLLRHFATDLVPDRRFLEPERITDRGDLVVREGFYMGTPLMDLPGFGPAGSTFTLKFCSVMRFDSQGILLEWKDYG